jgi:hypothetical protein
MAQLIKLPPGKGWYYGWSCAPWSDLYWVDCTDKEWGYYHPWYVDGKLELSRVELRKGEVIVEWADILREGDPLVDWKKFVKS